MACPVRQRSSKPPWIHYTWQGLYRCWIHSWCCGQRSWVYCCLHCNKPSWFHRELGLCSWKLRMDKRTSSGFFPPEKILIWPSPRSFLCLPLSKWQCTLFDSCRKKFAGYLAVFPKINISKFKTLQTKQSWS